MPWNISIAKSPSIRIGLFFAVITQSTFVAAAEPAPPFASLVAQKERIAARLADQVAYCESRQDSDNPAFKGCIDWHSAVHGVWALTAYQRATGKRKYSRLVASILKSDALRRERDHLRRSPQFEMPYGRSWFLRLAIEQNLLNGASDLSDFADEVALSIRDFYRRREPDRLSGEYDSASWAVTNLLDYARNRNLPDLQAEAVDWIRRYFLAADPKCLYSRERGEFMAICTNWAMLASRVLDPAQYSSWVDRLIELNGLPVPIARPATAHEFGLNFSRAWGLWDMYDKTGRPDVAAAYADAVNHGLTPASNWNGNYGAVGHWVAQFGMYAIQPLFGPKKGR